MTSPYVITTPEALAWAWGFPRSKDELVIQPECWERHDWAYRDPQRRVGVYCPTCTATGANGWPRDSR